jgi:hypothetical protein
MIRAQLAAAIAVALAVPTVLTGCVALPDGVVIGDVTAGVHAALPEAHGILVGLSYDGTPDRRAVNVKVYVGAGGSPDLASIVNRVLKATWKSVPFEPAEAGVDVVEGEKPADASLAQVDGVDLTDAASTLGFDPSWVGLGGIQIPSDGMIKEYGAWKAAK